MSETPATKIVIVSGQEFSVPVETDNEAIREHLKGSGFPDVAAATIQTGTKTVEGTTYQTIEFVKKAGTKGLDGAELAALLSSVPAERLGVHPGIGYDQAALLRKLMAGLLTVGQAVGQVELLDDALQTVYDRPYQSEENVLCDHASRVPAVPCATLSVW